MSLSRPCDNCCVEKGKRLFKQVSMYLDDNMKATYLCRPCARELGYNK